MSIVLNPVPPELQLEYRNLLKFPEKALGLLAEHLKLSDYRFNARSAAQVDYLSYVLQFAIQEGFSHQKTRRLTEIAQVLMMRCAGDSSFQELKSELEKQLLASCRPHPHPEDESFSPSQISHIAHFFVEQLLWQHKLYSYVFTHEQEHVRHSVDLLVESPDFLPDLETGMLEEDWLAHQERIAAQKEAERKAKEQEEEAQREAEKKLLEEQQRLEEEQRRKEFLEKKPRTLEEAVEKLVATRLEQERLALAQEYKAKEQALLAQIGKLEVAAAAVKGPVRKQ